MSKSKKKYQGKKNSSLTPDQIERISKIINEGGSVRQAARDVLNKESRESTIRSYLKSNEEDLWGASTMSFTKEDNTSKPKVLVFDLETSPVSAAVWGLWNQNIGLNMIESEWFILSYAAKWLGDENSMMYSDMRGIVATEDDTHILDAMWKLLDEADIVITQNGKKFDVKKINARFILNGYKPPSSYKHIDTLQIAKATFGFTSNRLEWMTDKLNVKFKKLSHGSFAGYELWKQMKLDNLDAFIECEEYNNYDVLSLEELYLKLAAWDNKHPNFNLYHDENKHVCRCGSTDVVEYGYAYTGKSKFQRYRCNSCGAETRDSVNLFDKDKRKSLHLNVTNQ